MKLPQAPNIFGYFSTYLYYRLYNISANRFNFIKTNVTTFTNILKNIDSSKAAGIDNIGGKCVKDGTLVIALPIAQLCNLSIKLITFPDTCEIAKVKPIFKKSSKTAPKNY